MKKVERLDFLNGIKVLSFLCVFHVHFFNAFYPAIYSLDPADSHTDMGIEAIIGCSPLNIISAGKFTVRLFLILSGFFVARKYFLTGKETAIGEGAFKKYFRLVVPILFVNVLAAVLMYAGCYKNAEAAVAADSVTFFGSYNQFPPSIFGAAKEALWDCFFSEANTYNGPLWFIYYEFLGSLLVSAILVLFGKSRARYVVYGVSALLLARGDFLAPICGMVAGDLLYNDYKWVKKLQEQKWLLWLGFFGALLIATYPPIGEYSQVVKQSVYGLFPAKVLLYYIGAGTVVLFCCCSLEKLQKALTGRVFDFFCEISYCFYLIHFPVLCTVSSVFYLWLKDRVNYHVLALMNYILTIAVCTGLSWLLHRFVEKPGIRLAESVTRKLFQKGA